MSSHPPDHSADSRDPEDRVADLHPDTDADEAQAEADTQPATDPDWPQTPQGAREAAGED